MLKKFFIPILLSGLIVFSGCADIHSQGMTTAATPPATTILPLYEWYDPIWEDPYVETASGDKIYYRFVADYLARYLDGGSQKIYFAPLSLAYYVGQKTIAKVRLEQVSLSETKEGYLSQRITVEEYYSLQEDWSVPETSEFTVYESMGAGMNPSHGDGIVAISLGLTKMLLEGNSYYVRLYNDANGLPVVETLQDAEHFLPWESPLVKECGDTVQVYGKHDYIVPIEEIDFSPWDSAAQVQLYVRYSLLNEELYASIKDMTSIDAYTAQTLISNQPAA